MKNKCLVLLLFFLSGCGYFVTKEEFQSLQRQTYQLERELKTTSTTLSLETGGLKSTTERLDELHDKLRKSFADTNVRIDEIDFSLSRMKGDFENFKVEMKEYQQKNDKLIKIQTDFIQKLNYSLDEVRKDVVDLNNKLVAFSNITTELVTFREKLVEIEKRIDELNKKREEKQSLPSKKEMYDKALELYNKGEFESAINAFEAFLAIYSQDELTDNALYWIGESYYAQKKYNEALSYFHRVVIDYPNADKVPSALYKEALTLEHLGMAKEAEGALKELLARFPFTQEANEARKRLKKR